MLLNLILSADPLKDDQNCQDRHEEDNPKSSPFDFVIKQFQGKRCAPEKRQEQPSAIKQFFKGFDFGKSEGKDRREVEETEISNAGADDQSEKQDLSVEGNTGTICVYILISYKISWVFASQNPVFAAYSLSSSQDLLLIGALSSMFSDLIDAKQGVGSTLLRKDKAFG